MGRGRRKKKKGELEEEDDAALSFTDEDGQTERKANKI